MENVILPEGERGSWGNNNSGNSPTSPKPPSLNYIKFVSEAIQQKQLKYKASYSNPASIKMAQKHQKATKYGYKPPNLLKKAPGFQRQSICGCCNLNSNNQQIQLFHRIEPPTDSQEVYKLTQDVALFFTFIKNVIVFIVINTVIHSAFNILSSEIAGGYCDKIEKCNKGFWAKTSISNKYDRQDLVSVVNILDLVSIVVSIVYFGWSRRYFYKVSQNIDRSSVSQGDFTILVSNIPRIEYPESSQNLPLIESSSRQKLKQFIQQIIKQGIRSNAIFRQDSNMQRFLQASTDLTTRGRNRQKITRSISLCYNLSQLEILHDQKWGLIWTFQSNFILLDILGIKIPDLFGFKSAVDPTQRSARNNQLMQDQLKQPQKDKNGNFIKRLQTNLNQEVDYNLLGQEKKNELNSIRKKINFINESQIALSNELVKNKQLFFHNTNFSGKAFVSFEYEDFKEYLHKKYEENPGLFVFEGNQLKIEDACDPTDVNWYNMRISDSQRSNRICFSYLVLMMLLMFSFLMLFSVELLKRNYANSQKGGILNFAKTQGLSLITSLIILGCNALFDFVSWFLTNQQGHTTKTSYMFSQVIKTFFSRLINTIMMYFMISVILTKDYQQQKFLSSTGLVTQIYNFIVVSGLINLIHAFINKDELWARFKRWYIYYYRQIGDSVYTKFQISLNQQFQLPQFNLVYKYNDYLVTLYTALFYSYLVPIGIPTLIIIFGIQYWIDKFTLFKRSTLKNNFNYSISIYVRKIFQSSIVMFALGNLVFSYYLEDYTISVLNLIALALTVVFAVCVWIAPEKIQRKLFGTYEVTDVISYTKCVEEARFKTTYWNQNPATFCVDEHLENSRIGSSSRIMKRN